MSCEHVNNSQHTDIHDIHIWYRDNKTFCTSKQCKAYNRQRTTQITLQKHTRLSGMQSGYSWRLEATRANGRQKIESDANVINMLWYLRSVDIVPKVPQCVKTCAGVVASKILCKNMNGSSQSDCADRAELLYFDGINSRWFFWRGGGRVSGRSVVAEILIQILSCQFTGKKRRSSGGRISCAQQHTGKRVRLRVIGQIWDTHWPG